VSFTNANQILIHITVAWLYDFLRGIATHFSHVST